MTPTKRAAGRILVDQLRIHGTDCAFTVPGESFLPVLDAFHDVKDAIKLVVCRNEIGAANMETLIVGALDFDAPRTIDEFAKTTIAELDAVMARATAMGVMRLRPGAGTAPPGGGPGETVPTF